MSLVLLRPLSVCMIGYAIFTAAPTMRDARANIPLVIFLCAAALMILQLVPLPPAWWQSLPSGPLIARIGADAGIGEVWRPLTLSPARTQNSLFALGVPIATLLLCARYAGRQNWLVWMIVAAGAVDAVLGLLQIIGPADSPFYTYRITNNGLAVGLFANRNHNAIFLASLVPLLAYLALTADPRDRRTGFVRLAAFGGALFILPMVLVSGSRGGTILTFVAIAATTIFWLLVDRRREHRLSTGPGRPRQLAVLLLVGGALALVGAATIFFSRSMAIDRLLGSSLDTELRAKAFSYLVSLAKDFFPWGSGFGTFDLVYKVVEPDRLLGPLYLNQAHNDALQIAIEGGLAGLVLLLAGLTWFAVRGVRLFARALRFPRHPLAIGVGPSAWLSLAILLAGSLFDYPLRTPALMCVGVILCSLLSKGRKADDARRTDPAAAARPVNPLPFKLI